MAGCVIQPSVTPFAGCRAGLVALALSTPLSVMAQLPEQIRIDWHDSGACARPATLEREIGRLLDPRPSPPRPLAFDVRVTPTTDGGYAVNLRVDDTQRRAERNVQVATCREVEETAVLLIASAIDPMIALRSEPPAADAGTPPPAAEVAPPAPAEPPSVPAEPAARAPSESSQKAEQDAGRVDGRSSRPTRRSRSRWSLYAGGVFDAFSLPEPTAGPTLGLVLSLSRLQFWIAGQYLLAQTALAQMADVRSSLDLMTGAAGAAYSWELGVVRLGPTLQVESGALRIKSEGTESVQGRTRRPWAAVLAGANLGLFPRAPVGLELNVWAGIPVRPWPLDVQGDGQRSFYTTERFTLRASLAVRISLGPRS